MITLLLSFFCFVSQPNIYAYSATDIYGDSIHFSDYAGKKIMIVNAATGSAYVDQYAQLEKLYSLYKDSLVIIAFSSNSFGNEPDDASNIIDFVNNNYHTSYILGDLITVTGAGMPPLYQWLCDTTRLGAAIVSGDFQKFLIGTTGEIIGVYAGSVDPMDDLIQNQIKGIPNQ